MSQKYTAKQINLKSKLPRSGETDILHCNIVCSSVSSPKQIHSNNSTSSICTPASICVGLYEKTFFALLATEDTYAAGVYSYLCRVILRKMCSLHSKGKN